MNIICGICGENISVSDSNYYEEQCGNCGAYNKVFPHFIKENNPTPEMKMFSEYLNYPQNDVCQLSAENQKRYFKILKDLPEFFSMEELYHAINFVYAINNDQGIPWLGLVSDKEQRFPANVIAMEILGNSKNIQALYALLSNSSFGYLGESLKDPLPGGGLFSMVIQTAASTSRNKYSDISYCELSVAPFVPGQLMAAVPELIRKVQCERFRIKKACEMIGRFGITCMPSLWNIPVDKHKRLEFEVLIALIHLSMGMTDQRVYSAMDMMTMKQIKQNGDYAALILSADKMVEFSVKNPDNNIYHTIIQRLLSHKDNRVRIGAASSILYQDFENFTTAALDEAIAFLPMMKNAINFSAYIKHNPKAMELVNQS